MFWKSDWPLAQERLRAWWRREGPALCVTAPKDEPWEDVPDPGPARDPEQFWSDLDWRLASLVCSLSRTYFGGVAFPFVDTQIGPGSLGLFLGNEPGWAWDTVWYEPCIADPSTHPPLTFQENRWLSLHLDFIRRAEALSEGRFLVGIPDLIENLDTLAQLREPQTLMEDLIERPEWVSEKIAEINRAYFEVFDRMYSLLSGGGNAFAAFQIWGPGKTAKVQCDASAMISPAMFRRFVVPALTEQCEWLDYSMYHLDGTQAIAHLDALLEIEALDAIEWTPQAGIERGGDPRWFDLYRRIRAAGKSVQAIEVLPEQVGPLVDSVGPEGLFMIVSAESEEQARELEAAVHADGC
ncbi:MAG TPA: hypothetical protein VMI31_04130 [Fimbriimonadaceae bacterium]|nr:hypothetical protein [Fimbriimonadaceae bacterium]